MEVGKWVVFLDFEGFYEIINGIFNEIGVSVANSPLNVSIVLVLMFEIFDGLFEVIHGGFITFLFSVNHTQVKQCFSICAWTELESLFETFDRLFELYVNRARLKWFFVVIILLEFALTQRIIKFDFAFIVTYGDGLLEVTLCSFVVLKLEFTKSSEVVNVVQMKDLSGWGFRNGWWEEFEGILEFCVTGGLFVEIFALSHEGLDLFGLIKGLLFNIFVFSFFVHVF